jgi:glycosyltransferase involved in cell wall biosynthesis
VPLVSVLLAVHNDDRHISYALESVRRQAVGDLELVVVDDASTDGTPALLATASDPRIVVLRNVEQLGLAASLNRGLDRAQGRYLARLDSDDVALPEWLARLLVRIRAEPPVAIVGTGIVELDADGRPGSVHRLARGPSALSWQALFSAPFFHSTILLDRERLDAHGLRYDPSYLESEDYDLWARFLAVEDGDNLPDPLVLRRMHPAQAQARRGDLQRSFQRRVALREIARVAPGLSAEDAELAWRVGSGQTVPGAERERAGAVFVALLDSFEQLNGPDPSVRDAAARALGRAGHVGRGLRVAPSAPARLAVQRTRRRLERPFRHRRAEDWLAELRSASAGVRVTIVSPEPTPYRSPLFDRVAARAEIDLTVVYAARTVAGRTWSVTPNHRAVFLGGARVPGLHRVLRHDYPVTPAIGRVLRRSRPEVVVVSGWSTFPAQAALAWCRARKVPYVLLVESHDLGPRSGWRRAVKGAIVPRIVRGAASVLVVGTAARESVLARGAPPERVRVFANTVDVSAWSERAVRLAERRSQLRSESGVADDDVVVLSVGRLVFDKGLDVLIRGAAAAGDGRLRLVYAGGGPDEAALVKLARELDVRLLIRGDLPEAALAAEYVKADAFALLSVHETWGVVVNEAAASGLPLVLSERVGAARDLLRGGENGFVVPSADVAATAAALKRLAEDPALRRAAGERSRELVRGWGYEPSVDNLVAAVRAATSR